MVAPVAQPPAPTPPHADGSRAGLSDRDARLVTALVNPSPEGDTLLADFDPAHHADWLDRPEVQRAIAAAQAIRDLRLRAKAAQRAERAMDRLSAVLDHASDLKDDAQRTETRRAASVLARISTQCLAWTAPSSPLLGGGGIAGRSPAMTVGAPSSPSATRPRSTSDLHTNGRPSSPAHLFTCSPAQAPPELPRLVKYAPAPAAASILARLRAIEAPTPKSLAAALESVLDQRVSGRYSPDHDRFIDDLMASPAITARDRPFRAEPVAVEGRVATQRFVFTLEDGRETACVLRLAERPWLSQPGSPSIWLADSIRAEDSS